MAVIIYGTHVFTKLAGYFGQKEECPFCQKAYQKGYVKNTIWAHLEYIPLFPVKKVYFKMCPICGRGVELKNKEAKAEMSSGGDGYRQELEPFAKHVLANKPSGFMSTDNSYQFWIKDALSGEEILVASDLTRKDLKQIKKARGYKKLPLITT